MKRLAKDNEDANKEKEFLMELGIIGHVSHPNTASLVGCCFENGLYLIFSLSQNGNLASALHGKEDLHFSYQSSSDTWKIQGNIRYFWAMNTIDNACSSNFPTILDYFKRLNNEQVEHAGPLSGQLDTRLPLVLQGVCIIFINVVNTESYIVT